MGRKLITTFLWGLMLGIAVIAAIHFAVPARGHDAGGWNYPQICCHDADCAPVEWEGEKDGKAIANTKLHAGISTEPHKYTYRMTSPDGKRHVCATPDNALAPLQERKYYCIFDAAGM